MAIVCLTLIFFFKEPFRTNTIAYLCHGGLSSFIFCRKLFNCNRLRQLPQVASTIETTQGSMDLAYSTASLKQRLKVEGVYTPPSTWFTLIGAALSATKISTFILWPSRLVA
jgi:hypothetical protein